MNVMSDTLLEKMKVAAEAGHVAYTNFVRAYSKNKPNLVYCFFEGDEDKRYYGARITILYEREYKDFTCSGKDKVIKAQELIKNRHEYNDAKVLFFVDKDYSDDKTNNTIYVTPCYSIENFYSSTETLINVLQNEFNMSDDEDIEKVIKLYDESLTSFHNKLLFLNIWLAYQHDIRIESKLSTRLNINEALKKYFKVDENMFDKNLKVKVDIFNDLENIDILENILFPSASKISTEAIQEKRNNLDLQNLSCSFRGKFEFKFFIDFLKKLKEEVGSKNQKILPKKYKCNLYFQIDNGISVLTNYAITPSCLKVFLNSNLKAA